MLLRHGLMYVSLYCLALVRNAVWSVKYIRKSESNYAVISAHVTRLECNQVGLTRLVAGRAKRWAHIASHHQSLIALSCPLCRLPSLFHSIIRWRSLYIPCLLYVFKDASYTCSFMFDTLVNLCQLCVHLCQLCMLMFVISVYSCQLYMLIYVCCVYSSCLLQYMFLQLCYTRSLMFVIRDYSCYLYIFIYASYACSYLLYVFIHADYVCSFVFVIHIQSCLLQYVFLHVCYTRSVMFVIHDHSRLLYIFIRFWRLIFITLVTI